MASIKLELNGRLHVKESARVNTERRERRRLNKISASEGRVVGE